jgi:hypothetical protein
LSHSLFGLGTLVGVLPALVAFCVRYYLREPMLFVAATKQERINAFSVLFADRDATRATPGSRS